MLKKEVFLFLVLSICNLNYIVGQEEASSKERKENKSSAYSPTIGLGVGMFKFYGDILDANYGNPLISNIGYDLHVKQQLNNFLTGKFYVLFGVLSANERSINRNLNFRSNITVGGFAFLYNFDNLLKDDRVVSPFISLGIESVEFHSKTDLLDQNGNEYNYWSDGSIRDVPENSPSATNSNIIQRDYTYETDLRESNFDSLGRYPERTFAIPLGIGAKMHVTNNIDFTIGTTFHWTFSDLIDNVTEDSDGERIGTQRGNGGNDKFLMTSFSISYNFQKHEKKGKPKEFFEDVDYLAVDGGDEDEDGVQDFADECPWTPIGVEVDAKGCPLDKDGDLVPNYKDDELESRPNAIVSQKGVELTDTMIYEAYQRYMDTTGMFAEMESRLISHGRRKKKVYKVQVGEYTVAITADLVDKFLSIPDVQIKTFGDSLTLIVVGDYDNIPEALRRKVKLTKEGFEGAIVVEQDEKGMFKSVGDEINNMPIEDVEKSATKDSRGLIFRVQLGAFSKKVPNSHFNNLKDVMVIKADDGLYKYLYTGVFKTVKEAVNKRLDLAIDYGVNDAFIVAYKDGKRISLKEAGMVAASKDQPLEDTSEIKEEVKYAKSDITFKIQVGTYKNQLPTDVLNTFLGIDGIELKVIEGGMIRYTAGRFTSFKEASEYRNKIIASGISGAFIIAFNKEELISVEKAKEVLAE